MLSSCLMRRAHDRHAREAQPTLLNGPVQHRHSYSGYPSPYSIFRQTRQGCRREQESLSHRIQYRPWPADGRARYRRRWLCRGAPICYRLEATLPRYGGMEQVLVTLGAYSLHAVVVHKPAENRAIHWFGNLCLISHSKNLHLSNFQPQQKQEYFEASLANNQTDSLKLLAMIRLMKDKDRW